MKKHDLFVLISLICIGAVLVLFLGQEASWDLANYHYYNPWALFHNRIGWDVMPCGLQSYMNPLLDVPFYILIKFFNNYPRLIMCFQSIYYGISLFIVYLLTKEIFKSQSKLKYFLIVFSIIVAATDFNVVSEIGTTFNDLPISVFILISLLLIIKNLFCENSKKRTRLLSLAGLLIGIAAGLKNSALFFFISILFSVLCFSRNFEKPLKVISFFIVSFIIGYILTNGWWMYIVYSHFKNPFFPYMNNIFHSPYALDASYADTRYLPANTLDYRIFGNLSRNTNILGFVPKSSVILSILYPFYFNIDFVVSELFHIDYRPLCFYILFFFIFSANIVFTKYNIKFKEKLKKETNINALNFLIFVVLFSYIIWLKTSCIIRYILPISLIEGIFIANFILYFKIIFNSTKIPKILLAITLIFFFTTTVYPPRWQQRIEYKDKFLNIPKLNIPDNANVFLFRSYPNSIYIPFQNPTAKYYFVFANVYSNYDYEYPDEFKEKLKTILKQKNSYLLLSYIDSDIPLNYKIVSEYTNINDFDCEKVNIPINFSLLPTVEFCSKKDLNNNLQ